MQEKYKDEILLPWGLTEATGFVYKTTIAHINRRLCNARVQCPVFTEYHKVGDVGGQVPQIQRFLRDLGYYGGTDNGIFDAALKDSIAEFQEEFRPMILTPWGIENPTGYWYKTPCKQANWLHGCFEEVTVNGETF